MEGERAPSEALWRNRIVANARRDPTKLRANALNWRTHPPEQRAALMRMMDEVGWVQSVVWNKRTENLIDGHLRVEIAVERGERSIPVVVVDLSPEEERKVLASLDSIGGMATVNTENLGALLRDISLGEDELSGMLRKLGQRNGVLEIPDAEVKVAPARETQWMVLIECADEGQQTLLLERFAQEGLRVRALIG